MKTIENAKDGTDAVRRHLISIGSLTQKQCTDYYGASRLSAIVHRLNKRGADIKVRNKKVKTRYNKTTIVAEYYLSQFEQQSNLF